MEAVKNERLYSLTIQQGMRDCVSTLIGYISIGLAAGIVGAASHLSILEVGLLALLVYAGAAQFIICALIVTQTPIWIIILTTFIVNLRHLLLCMVLAPQFRQYSLWRNIGIGSLVTDETFGVAATKLARKETFNDQWMIGLNVTAYISWVLSCIVGAMFGKWVKNPEIFGLDFALTAMFIALLVLQLEGIQLPKLKLNLFLILLATIFIFIFSFVMPTYLAILCSTCAAATIGVWMDK